MPPLETLIAFAAATALFAFLPGPALLYTAARTIAGGRRAGFAAAFGIHIGCYAHVFAAALGLSAIFAEAPTAYAALKIAGALYLGWLGLGLLREAARRGESALDAGLLKDAVRRAPKAPRHAFAESVLVELLNPKVALFFIAFLPQFVDPSFGWPVWAQLLILGVIVNLSFTTADLLAALFTDRLSRAVRGAGWGERVAKALGGATLLGLGAHLAFSRDP
ncbi:MAG: LysE family translocator [Pseudomonadota bacterium]